jgi:trehalose 6-phosphate phosphatase
LRCVGEIALQLPLPGTELKEFFDLVRRGRHRVLLLDYDGTLAPFQVDRQSAAPYPEAKALLTEIIAQRSTRVAIITGRSIANVRNLLGLTPLPEIWGSHGWEHLSGDGTYSLAPLDEQSSALLVKAAAVLGALNKPNLCEKKPVSVAAHWRGFPPEEIEEIRSRVLSDWTELAADSELRIHSFDGGLELRAKGRDKGSAVSDILSQVAGGLAAAYLGDDLTDEDAFNAMGHRGLRVLVRETPQETSADIWLKPPEGLIEFLSRWKEAAGPA